MKQPKISIVMPFYNCEEYLDDAIQSILDQSFTDFEFIIINDASTDKSDKVVKKYASKDNRIIYIKNPSNVGIVENLNKGIETAKGEYIARMDGDDISMLDRLEKQLKYLKENKDISIVGGYAEIIDENNNQTGILKKPIKSRDIETNLFLFLTIIHGTALIRKEVYDKIGCYNNDYLYTEDNEWTYRAIYGHKFKGGNIPDVVYRYRKHSNSSSTNSKLIAKLNLKLRKEVISKYKFKPGFKNVLGMYTHYILGFYLNSKTKEKIESILKKII